MLSVDAPPRFNLEGIGFWARDSRMAQRVENFRLSLDRLEALAASVDEEGKLLPDTLIQSWVEETKSALAQLKGVKGGRLKEAKTQLKRTAVALQYRAGSLNGGQDPKEVDSTLLAELVEIGCTSKTVAEETCRYPIFARRLLRDPALRSDFFRWTLRDGNSAESFVLFPRLAETIDSSDLASRFGRFQHLKVETLEGGRALTFPVMQEDGRALRYSLLDLEKTVHFSEESVHQISEIFRAFGNRARAIGFEMFQEGMRRWDVSCWSGVNMESENWWEALPLYRTVTLEEAREQFGKDLDGKSWVAQAKSTYLSSDYDLEGNHAYLDVLIPDEAGGYRIYPFGKYPKTYPVTLIEKLLFLAKTNYAALHYPDENVFYTNRKEVGRPFIMTPEEGHRLMERIRKDVQESGQEMGDFVFQFAWHNCANWVQELLEEVLGKKKAGGRVPNLFRISVREAAPQHPVMKPLFRFLQALPDRIHRVFVHSLNRLIGAWRSTEVKDREGQISKKSVVSSPFWERLEIYHPVKQVRKKGVSEPQLAS